MIRPSVLLFALLMSAPAWYRLLLDEIDIMQVLIRFLIAVPIAAVLLAGFRFIIGGYRASAEPAPTPVTPERFDSSEPEKSP
ncbi:hypothetical protein AB0F81_51215 [Actinoplanes sp. NPDC024001]|uniref:hypothetical protein n=1 Tax=Actinoplanes sp. NPDC024001 TaxID=3154598 RepID=UPI0033F02211